MGVAVITRRGGYDIFGALERATLADSTRDKYAGALLRFLDTGGDLFDADDLAAHAATLPNSGDRKSVV